MIKNSKLQNLFKLSSKVTVIVPATININEEIDNAKYVDSEADLQTNIEKVIDKCAELKENLKQDAIALEINGEMYFI